MKKIGIIAVCVFCITAGSVFGQGGTLNSDALESDSLKALKYGLWDDSIDGSNLGGKLELPDVYQHSIPDSLLKFYRNDLTLPENRFYYRYDSRQRNGDGKPGLPVPEGPLPKYFDQGVPYYDNMPNPLNNKKFDERRSVPIPGFPGWKVQEITMKSERS